MNIRQVRKLGKEAGQNAADWKFDGNTNDYTFTKFLYDWNNCDTPDCYLPPNWLSGEWAGESITELLGEYSGNNDEHCQAYEDSAEQAYWSALEKTALDALGVKNQKQLQNFYRKFDLKIA